MTGCRQPHVLRFCDERGVRDEASVVAFLKSTTMVPRPTAACVSARDAAAGRPAARAASHPRSKVPQQQQHAGARRRLPAPRHDARRSRQVWLTTYIWGIIYLRNQEPLLFDSACVRLFKISFAE